MKISITPGLCQGHNNCSRLAPELFTLDENGYAMVRMHDTLPSELEDLAEMTANSCPECAINIEYAEEACIHPMDGKVM
ncbi:ferredoxin [Pandoraea pnomenusa]|uniref:ferredoxin n=1 Tax=Pandoraea pnomenusa TaxID=93220 RepID=UPI001198A01C|nr:ferredoxin [Pandoraea pnomenusa]QDX20849.1 ferredoxin [Pandoraea pnomenusa]